MTNRGTCEIYGCRCQKLAPLPSYDWVDAWLVFPLLVSQSVCSTVNLRSKLLVDMLRFTRSLCPPSCTSLLGAKRLEYFRPLCKASCSKERDRRGPSGMMPGCFHEVSGSPDTKEMQASLDGITAGAVPSV